MRPLSYVVAPSAAAVLLLLASAVGAAAEEGDGDGDFTIKDPRITESSGLAASRLHPGIYWTHNDSDDGAFIYAVDSRSGETVATLTMRGVGSPRDVEAISIGPDGNLYVGDIGDNLDGSWSHVWIYRFPEPKQLRNATVDATQFTVKYADGPRNAEALMVHPKTGRVYIASKNEDGGGLYEGPARLSAGGTNVFRRVGEVPWVTDGAFSPGGNELVLRSYFSARAYEWKDNGRLGADRGVGAPFQGQAESVTYTADGTAMMFGSEGVGSDVQRVDVEGRKGRGDDGSGDKSPSSGGGAREDGKGGEGGGDGSGDGSGDSGGGDGKAVLGLVVLGGVFTAFLGLKRLRRRA